MNLNINENLNKIEQLQNDIQVKNKSIENKLIQIKDDENFINEIEQEKLMYIENISDDIFSEILGM